jgi:hypothetical protein
MVVNMSFKNCLENALVPDVAVAVGDDDDAIIDVIEEMDELRMLVEEDNLIDEAADDCVALAASGDRRASALQAVALAVLVPT